MHKIHQPHKRRAKQFLQKLLHIFAIFLITFGILLALFRDIFIHPNTSVVSPLSKQVVAQKNPSPSTDPQTTLTQLLKQANIETQSITVASDSSLLVTLSSNQELIFSPQKDIAQQISSLQVITKQLTIEGKRFTRVDLRFDNPVVAF